ncbi:hypothetical protein GBA52_020240 [Prunus armeniaca]|nr:hypothetical protein GBA52_020240 [Prunus armeniaca]
MDVLLDNLILITLAAAASSCRQSMVWYSPSSSSRPTDCSLQTDNVVRPKSTHDSFSSFSH